MKGNDVIIGTDYNDEYRSKAGDDEIKSGVDNLMLDVDDDGKVTAFGDGLMVIRKLFGTAFSGDALTAKAISADATRDTDEIHDYINAMTTVDPIG